MKNLQRTLREVLRYPSAIAGLTIILCLVAMAIYAVIAIPYREAIRLWRGGEEIWQDYPRNAAPIWQNWLTKTKLCETLIMKPQDKAVSKSVTVISKDMTDIEIVFPFEYTFDTFPQELSLYLTSKYKEKQPHVAVIWRTPDGREINMADFSAQQSQSYRISQDSRLQRRLGGMVPERGLFADPAQETPVPLKGNYQLVVSSIVFEPDSDVDAKFVLYGQVYGLAGTDHNRRDLMIAILWGTPIALAFGLLAALGTTVTTMFIAGISTWFGGVVDDLIQRVTEVNLLLPALSILIMVGTFYSRSIWLMLGILVLLRIFGQGIKGYRAIFLQVKESPYIEAARAYGASNFRIILLYLIPRIIPLLVPELVVLVPGYVFTEASLAVLGLGDPVLPTWGKIIDDARVNGALFNGQYYWILEPSVLLMLTGLGFAMVGFALDRIFNPRLRGL